MKWEASTFWAMCSADPEIETGPMLLRKNMKRFLALAITLLLLAPGFTHADEAIRVLILGTDRLGYRTVSETEEKTSQNPDGEQKPARSNRWQKIDDP